LLLCLFALHLVSCDADGRVLGLSPDEAAGLLERGETGFIIESDPAKVRELGRLHPLALFYAGLLVEDQAPDMARALYEAVITDSSSAAAREAASEKLIPWLLSAGSGRALADRLLRAKGSLPGALKSAALYALDRPGDILKTEPSGTDNPWQKALRFTAGLKTGAWETVAERERAAEEYFFTNPIDGSWNWALEASGGRDILSASGEAALLGRLAIARSDYAGGLGAFRTALEEGPELFSAYPDLVNDLGRAFQFTATGDEGILLFTAWEAELASRTGPVGNITNSPEQALRDREVRYRLLHFAARIARQQQINGAKTGAEGAVSLFTRALALAPDAVQSDACIWYIINVSFLADPGSLLPVLGRYIPRMADLAYFDDMLDRYCRYLTAARDWDSLEAVYGLLPRNAGGAARAQYAYILGRVSQAVPSRQPEYFAVIREESGAALYYRIMAGVAGDAIGEYPPAAYPHAGETEFLLGFFQWGAAAHAGTYLAKYRDRLSIEELRAVAEAYYQAEMWEEALRLAVSYMGRESYRLTRRDLELAHPRPFRDLIEPYAAEAEIPPAVLYGLVRTESAFAAAANSWAGAVGLAQLMPDTALEMAGRLARQGGPDYAANGALDLQDPELSIHLGAVYLRYLENRMENMMLSLLAYNGGMGRVDRWRRAAGDLPADLFLETVELDETRDYGKRVLTAAAVYGYLYYDMTMEEIAADIYR
jgi:soluble lytic murein transglycosylase